MAKINPLNSDNFCIKNLALDKIPDQQVRDMSYKIHNSTNNTYSNILLS